MAFVGICLGLMLVTMGRFLLHAIEQERKRLLALPRVTGEITAHQVLETTDADDTPVYVAAAVVRYEINGEAYEAVLSPKVVYKLYHRPRTAERALPELSRRFPVGTSLRVRVDPQQPATPKLDTQLTSRVDLVPWGLILGGIGVSTLGVLGLAG